MANNAPAPTDANASAQTGNAPMDIDTHEPAVVVVNAPPAAPGPGPETDDARARREEAERNEHIARNEQEFGDMHSDGDYERKFDNLYIANLEITRLEQHLSHLVKAVECTTSFAHKARVERYYMTKMYKRGLGS